MDDENYFRRVYRSSVIIWFICCPVAWWLGGLPAVAGWTVGSGLSIGVMRSFEWMARRLFVPGATESNRDFTRFSILKLPVILAVVAALVLVGGRSLPAIVGFCAGVLLTQSVIVIKTVAGLFGKEH